MAISCDHVFCCSALNHKDILECLVWVATEDFSVPVRSVLRVPVSVRSARGGPVPPGICFVSGQAHDKVGVWDSLSQIDNQGKVFSVVVNATDFDQVYQKNDLMGFADPVLESWIIEHGNVEGQVAGRVSQFENESYEPVRGPVRNSLSAEDKEALLEKLVIKAPPEFFEKYKNLLLDYHNVCLKLSFDVGVTDVVQHKVSLTSEDPIHVRQFRIPFEHCQTIYDWVDELLKKGAIEVSGSCFNSPIFLVPKAGGRGMRAVLDFRQVNSASVPDRYTIREVRDCVDEIGLRGLQVFSTIDLTSGFWQQSLEKSSRRYTALTVSGKGTRYQWTVTPMGLQGSPASFARLIDYCMREIPGILTYIDDVLIHCPDHPSQLETLKLLFRV